MTLAKNQLDLHEVDDRLNSVCEPVTDHLYRFGLDLLTELDHRFEYLDRKATTIAGYSGAAVALLVSTIGTWPHAIDPYMVPVVLVAGVSALLAGGSALAATWMSDMYWFSPNDWIRKECLSSAEELKKYWIKCIYSYRQIYRDLCDAKAKWIDRAQNTFLLTTGLLLVALLDAAWRSPALLHRLGIR